MIFQVENAFNPERNTPITNKTKLGKGVTMAKFLGGPGNASNFNHITDVNEKIIIAKQLCLHAAAMKTISENEGQFKDYRLVVSEGLYKKFSGEQLQIDSVNFLKSTGRAVVYELRDMFGNIAFEKTFDLAQYWKDNLQFEKMILSYDTYSPSGKIHAEIVLIMPRITPPWEVEYANKIETTFNNHTQTNGELVEILKSG